MIPSALLLNYFELAQQRLGQQRWIDDDDELTSNKHQRSLSWHRSKIVEAQLTSLDDAISEWQKTTNVECIDEERSSAIRNYMQDVLRQIGLGDYSSVSYEGTSIILPGDDDMYQQSKQGVVKENINEQQQHQQQQLLSDAVEKTNELARRAFSRSVLISEWRLANNCNEQITIPQSRRELRGDNSDVSFDDSIILEYCGLVMAAVRLPEVQQYLQTGSADFIHSNLNQAADKHNIDPNGLDDLSDNKSAEERLLHIQRLYWSALGWDPDYAMKLLKCLLLGEEKEESTTSDLVQIKNNVKVIETLTQYSSAMTVAATNAAMANSYGNANNNNSNGAMSDDGTTRVVSVSYSEKIITVPTNEDGNIITTNSSTSAPTTNTIDEHTLSQQRGEMETAKATSMLQQQLWDDFQSLPKHEQMKTIQKAKVAHEDFLVKVSNTPPGNERILLMQSMDREMQRLLVIYKLWNSTGSSGSG